MRSAPFLLVLAACSAKKAPPAPPPAPDAAPAPAPTPAVVDRCALVTALDLAEICGAQEKLEPDDESRGCSRHTGDSSSYARFVFYTTSDDPIPEASDRVKVTAVDGGTLVRDHRAMESETISFHAPPLVLEVWHNDSQRPACTDDQLAALGRRARARYSQQE